MARIPLPPVATALSFVDCVNRGDIDGLARLMADGYFLQVFDEPPEEGRELGVEGWRGYLSAFPAYIIYPRVITDAGSVVAILGHTTGSHLDLADEDESKLTLIWLAEIDDGLVRFWTLIEDTAENRAAYGLA